MNCPIAKIKSYMSNRNIVNKWKINNNKTLKLTSSFSEFVSKILEKNKLSINIDEFIDLLSKVNSEEEARKLILDFYDYNTEDWIIKEFIKLRKKLNNLHLIMFWDYFEDKINELWEHDFFSYLDWKIVNVSNDRLNDNNFVNYELCKRNKNKLKATIYFTQEAIEWILLKTFFKKSKLNEHKRKDLVFKQMSLINIWFKEVSDKLYIDFLEENKNDPIIKWYNVIESLVKWKIWMSSKIWILITNFNFINKYLENKFENNINFSLVDFANFLESQNKVNLREAKIVWNLLAQVNNIYWLKYYIFDEKENAFILKEDNIPKDIIDNLKDKFKLWFKLKWYKWVCPWAITKNKKWESMLLESMSFWDKYYLKVIENYSNNI